MIICIPVVNDPLDDVHLEVNVLVPLIQSGVCQSVLTYSDKGEEKTDKHRSLQALKGHQHQWHSCVHALCASFASAS